MDQELEEFADLIQAADRIVLFTGAGISTEFGHPGFSQPGRDLDQTNANRLLRFHAV